ncbi:DUF2244 domain-containing protein [Saccharospirillum alexandrii]|uniref:DUF2244 domain-containing protein n=1 Tax=Saccharospirillum alexandrii TaxID=2448477 RepID=UPI00373529F7
MVTVNASDKGPFLVLQPNRSMSWQGTMKVLGALLAVSTVIVAGMVWIGAWVVLPFAGLEWLAVAAGLIVTAWRCQQQEVLWFEEDRIRLEQGVYRRQRHWEGPRRYTRLVISPPIHPLGPPQLALAYRDDQQAFAVFLNPGDVALLISECQRRGMLIDRRAGDQYRV